MKREVDRIWEMTAPKYGWKPLPELIEELNRHLKGWANYYRLGQPRTAFQRINRYVRQRLYQRLRRSSQRPWNPAPADRLWVLPALGTHLPVNAPCNKPTRKLDAGNPHVRFDEGEGS